MLALYWHNTLADIGLQTNLCVQPNVKNGIAEIKIMKQNSIDVHIYPKPYSDR